MNKVKSTAALRGALDIMKGKFDDFVEKKGRRETLTDLGFKTLPVGRVVRYESDRVSTIVAASGSAQRGTRTGPPPRETP